MPDKKNRALRVHVILKYSDFLYEKEKNPDKMKGDNLILAALYAIAHFHSCFFLLLLLLILFCFLRILLHPLSTNYKLVYDVYSILVTKYCNYRTDL